MTRKEKQKTITYLQAKEVNRSIYKAFVTPNLK